MSAPIHFDFFFNGESQSGSGMLEAIENKDGSFTAVNGFVRTFDYDDAQPLRGFEKTYEKMSESDIASLEKFSQEEVKGSEYFKLFSNSKDQELLLSSEKMSPEEIKNSEYLNLSSDPKNHEISLSPSGYFNYDNLLFPSSTDLILSHAGLLFMTENGKELNLFTDGPSNYVDYQNDGLNIQTSFHLVAASGNSLPGSPSELPDLPQITAVPEPSSLALLSLGLLSFCLVRLIITEGQRKKFSIFSGILGKQVRSFGVVMTWVGMTFVATPAQAAFINMPDFHNLSAFNLSGSTAGIDTGGRGVIGPNAGDDRVLRLTDNLWQAGSAFYATPFSLGGNASFSSYFEFQFAPTSQWAGADGMVFVIQNAGNTVGTMGGGIGYGGLGHSIGVEFDDWNNGDGDGNNANHAGIDINGNVNSVVRADLLPAQLDSGVIFHTWVDYNGVADLLEVRLGLTDIRPTDALMSYNVDLVSLLGSTNAYMGFTSGTGSVGSYHDIRNWVVEEQFNSIVSAESASQAIPEPTVLSLLLIALLGLWANRVKLGGKHSKLVSVVFLHQRCLRIKKKQQPGA